MSDPRSLVYKNVNSESRSPRRLWAYFAPESIVSALLVRLTMEHLECPPPRLSLGEGFWLAIAHICRFLGV